MESDGGTATDVVVGSRVRRLRRRRGLSQELVAHLVGRSERWLRDVEAGTAGLRVRDALSLADVLGVELEELTGAAGARHARPDPRPAGATPVDAERLGMALEGRTPVDLDLATSLGAVVRCLPRQLGMLSSRSLLQLAHGHLLSFRVLLGGAMPGPIRRELASAAAEAGVLAGMLAVGLGRGERAEGYFRHAAALAGTAGDAGTRLRALVHNSQLYSCAFMDGRREDPARARELLAQAAGLAVRCGADRALYLMRQAMERAVVRDERAAHALLDEADRARAADRIAAGAAPWWWHESFPAALRGKAALLAGHPDRATPLLEEVLSTLDPGMANRSRLMADLAAAYAQLGEIDHACALLGRALALDRDAGVVGSIPRTRRVRDRELRRHAAEPPVRRLDEQLREAAAAAAILSAPATASVSVTVGAWGGFATMARAM